MLSREDLRVWSAATIVDVLVARGTDGHDGGFSFLGDGESVSASLGWPELLADARAVSAAIREHADAGARALLFFRPGLDFLKAFLGCLHAGVIAVPCVPPSRPYRRSLERIQEIIRVAEPALVLGGPQAMAMPDDLRRAAPELARLPAIDPAELERGPHCVSLARGDGAAFLQFTSGSTSSPKGVIVTHANLMSNLAYIYDCFHHDASSVAVTWLPVFHDMGLIDGMLEPIFGGFRCVAMPPHTFVQRPGRWLRAITRHRATHSGGPNFAYDLCVDKIREAETQALDLSSWRVAYNGAEPIRVSTLESFTCRFGPRGFRSGAFHPCYGLAEATLKVTGSSADELRHRILDADAIERGEVIEAAPGAPRARAFASSGRPFEGLRLAIVDPETCHRSSERRLGEIWVSGPNVAAGYYRDEEATERAFRAALADGSPERYLRTGDLGFILDGELFVAGRLKDLIILAGRNLYPQDIERSAESAHPALTPGGAAAFSIDDGRLERLVVLVESAPASSPGGSVPDEIHHAVQIAVARDHQVDVDHVAVVARGSLLKTSSGKIRRRATRALYVAGQLTVYGGGTSGDTGRERCEP